MAILHRFGTADEFDPNKMLARELSYVSTTNQYYKEGLYLCYAPGDVRRQTTEQDIINILNTTPDVYSALQQLMADLQANPSELTNILNNIIALQSGKLDKVGDSKSNTVTFTEALTDTDIATTESHATIFGKILKSTKLFRANLTAIGTSISTITTNIGTLASLLTTNKTSIVNAVNELFSGKIDKTSIIQTTATNDATKVPSSAVTKSLQDQVTTANNNTVYQSNNISLASGFTTSESATAKKFGKSISVYFYVNGTIPSGAWTVIGTISDLSSRPSVTIRGLCANGPFGTAILGHVAITADGNIQVLFPSAVTGALSNISFIN